MTYTSEFQRLYSLSQRSQEQHAERARRNELVPGYQDEDGRRSQQSRAGYEVGIERGFAIMENRVRAVLMDLELAHEAELRDLSRKHADQLAELAGRAATWAAIAEEEAQA